MQTIKYTSTPVLLIGITIVTLFAFSGNVRADAEHMHGSPAKVSNNNENPLHGHWMAPGKEAIRLNPVPRDAASIERGTTLFQTNCVSCHGSAAKGDGPAGKALNPPPADLTVMAGLHPDGDFAWKIANGRNAMPAWKGILQQSQIWDLVNYIQSLKPSK
ncbi:MAG: cytochrome c [SAR324 cluster bacterium]|nr:cytochrome c [SAR324 cluster bacterium]